ncbi:MAG TPA: YggS family pyridoxal phosphate-dependent enzyme [Lachnospiraceae bacterium]|nr:YggS family pyridoxal phosphate-dependent enzyme [Lachnospiraceae bacterium]
MIKDDYEAVEANIEKACRKAGRSRSEVTLIAVSKTKPVEMLREVYDLGQRDFGENKVQEMKDKIPQLPGDIRWHLIGHLQTNKVKYIIDKVCMIHSVDSFHLAKEINKRAAQHDLTMDILIQVNSAMDENKFGITTDETDELIQQISEECPNIRIRGLMCIAPFEENVEDARPYFAAVKKIYDRYAGQKTDRVDFRYLSMGMTHDFQVAVEEGSNLIRVGTAIFGYRDYRKEEK